MSVAEAAKRPANAGRAVKLWLGLIALIAAGVGLAFFGASQVRAKTVQVETVQAGTGPSIKLEDGVLVDIVGRLPDGTEFENTRGQAVPLLVGQMIPGFAQGLTKMQKGGRYKLHIPSNLAYGSTPPPGSPIPPDADLDFDVHVVQVVPNAASMMAQQPGG